MVNTTPRRTKQQHHHLNKNHTIPVILALILLLSTILYLTYQPVSRKSIFPETLNDMTLTSYNNGEAAAREIQNMPWLQEIPVTRAYTATYTGSKGTMRIWVVEAENHNIANDAFNIMNTRLGASTEHSFTGDVGQTEAHTSHDTSQWDARPVKVDLPDLLKPEVYMMRTDNQYHYYYLKMDYKMGKIHWITFDHPDTAHQKTMVKQTILSI